MESNELKITIHGSYRRESISVGRMFRRLFKELKGYLGGSKLLRCSREKVEQDTNPFFLIGRWSSYTNTYFFFGHLLSSLHGADSPHRHVRQLTHDLIFLSLNRFLSCYLFRINLLLRRLVLTRSIGSAVQCIVFIIMNPTNTFIVKALVKNSALDWKTERNYEDGMAMYYCEYKVKYKVSR